MRITLLQIAVFAVAGILGITVTANVLLFDVASNVTIPAGTVSFFLFLWFVLVGKPFDASSRTVRNYLIATFLTKSSRMVIFIVMLLPVVALLLYSWGGSSTLLLWTTSNTGISAAIGRSGAREPLGQLSAEAPLTRRLLSGDYFLELTTDGLPARTMSLTIPPSLFNPAPFTLEIPPITDVPELPVTDRTYVIMEAEPHVEGDLTLHFKFLNVGPGFEVEQIKLTFELTAPVGPVTGNPSAQVQPAQYTLLVPADIDSRPDKTLVARVRMVHSDDPYALAQVRLWFDRPGGRIRFKVLPAYFASDGNELNLRTDGVDVEHTLSNHPMIQARKVDPDALPAVNAGVPE